MSSFLEMAEEVVRLERHQLAEELGMPPHGARFEEVFQKVVTTVAHALEKGDDSFKNVQSLIDSHVRLANNLRRKPKYDIKNAARNISRLRRSDPVQGLVPGSFEQPELVEEGV